MRQSVTALIYGVLALMMVLMVGMGCSQDVSEQASGTEKVTSHAAVSEKPVMKVKPIELSYSIFFPPSHAQCKAAEAWSEAVAQKTGGRVKINIFPGGTLTKANGCYDGVVTGISDIGMSCFAYTRGRFPVMEAMDLPFGYPSGMAATKIANQYYAKTKPAELDDVHVMYLHAHGPGLLHTQKPVKTLSDIKGMKIRSTGLSAKVVEALGGIPVAMPQNSTYEALQKGVVEGTFAPMETLKGWKQAEVIDHTIDCQRIGYTTTMFVVMNKDRWESLPEDIQGIFNELNEQWQTVHGETWDQADAEGRAFTLEQENSITELSEAEAMIWQTAVTPVIDGYIADAAKKGIDAGEAIAFLHEQVKTFSQQE